MTSDRQKYNNPMLVLIYDYLYTGDTMFGYKQEGDGYLLDDGSHVTLEELHRRKENFRVITKEMLREVFDEAYINKKEAHFRRMNK